MKRETVKKVRREGEALHVVTSSPEATVQRALRVGAADDRYEREADRVAAEVLQRIQVAGPVDAAVDGVQRRLDPSGAQTEAGHGPRGGTASADVEQQIRSAGGGRSLEPAVRREMESGFGTDFANVRIHSDNTAAELNRSLNARAFTKGSDIYFGKGEYQPGSDTGRTLLAHELTHTVQQSGGVQRSMTSATDISHDRGGPLRRWDLGKKIDVSQAIRIEPVKSGQAVFMVQDGSRDTIVIKAEPEPVNIMQLATLVHQSVHDTDVVNSQELDGAAKTDFLNKLNDPNIATGDNWAVVGASWKSWNKDGADDASHGRRGHQMQIGPLGLQAQKLAEGKDAKTLAKDTGKSGLKTYFESPAWMRKLGAATAADLLTGNADRVAIGNLGNWMTSADGKMTLIDNMDANAKRALEDINSVLTPDMKKWGANPVGFIADAVDKLLEIGTAESKGAFDYVTWAAEPGTLRRQFMIQDFTTGFEDARTRIVSKYADNKSNKEGRALKKAVKGLERDDQLDPWEVLKARARFLKDPKKAESLQKTLNKRNDKREKASAKKKK